MAFNPLRWAPFWWLLCFLAAAWPTGATYARGAGFDLNQFNCVIDGVARPSSQALLWIGVAWVVVLVPGAPAMPPAIALWRSVMRRRMGRVIEPFAIGVLVGIAVLDTVVKGFGGRDACGPIGFDWAAALTGWGPLYLVAAGMAVTAVRLRPRWEETFARRAAGRWRY